MASKNLLQLVLDPVERFLDSNIDNGNIWWYLGGFVVIILYLLLF